jgi:hypothetical protein
MLIVLLISLIGPLIVFAFADQITNLRYIQRTTFLSILQKQSDEIARGQEQLRASLADTIRKLDGKTDEKFEQSIRLLHNLADEMGPEQTRLAATIKEVQNSLIEDNNGPTGGQRDRDTYAPWFTRIGSLLFIVFAVRVFGNLYRYNTSYAVYYDGQADALQLYLGVSAEQDLVEFLERIGTVIRPTDIKLPEVQSPWDRLMRWRSQTEDRAGEIKKAPPKTKKGGNKPLQK